MRLTGMIWVGGQDYEESTVLGNDYLMGYNYDVEVFPSQVDYDCDVVQHNQCGTCYWYSNVGVERCDREYDPTTSDSKACEFYD